MVRHRGLGAWLLTTAVVVGGARAVALPETCGSTDSAARRRAVAEGVAWIERNQKDDGRFLYRYDAADDVEVPGYNWVRHAGTLFALRQVMAAGLDGGSASRAFEAGVRAIEQRIVTVGERSALIDGGTATTGGSALLVLALTEGGVRQPQLVRRLGHFLLSSLVRDRDGSIRVLEEADPDLLFAPDVVGRFTTGEVAFALTRLATVDPGGGWSDPVPGILRYLTDHKAPAEGFTPDMLDHWAAYALAEMAGAPNFAGFDAPTVGWIRKQAGLASVMVRYESQRTNRGIDRWLRGRTSVTSAVGTHGESLAGLVDVAAIEPRLSTDLHGLRDRLACNASLLVRRQIDAEKARSFASPERVRGAWLSLGYTEVDDQQHAISALLAADRVASEPVPRQDPLDVSGWLLLVAVVAAVNPPRVSAARRGRPRGFALSIGALALVGFGGPILRVLDVSVPTAVVASGVAVVLGALLALFVRAEAPTRTLAWARPEVAIVLLTLGAGHRGWVAVGGVVIAAAIARRSPSGSRWAADAFSVVAVAAGVAVIVAGVFAI